MINTMDDITFVGTASWKLWPTDEEDDKQYLLENLIDRDLNEDYDCGHCECDTGGRFIFCSRKCYEKWAEDV